MKISASSANWLAQDAFEVGEKPALTKAEREELVRLRRENRTLRAERELLSRAAAFFAQENVLEYRGRPRRDRLVVMIRPALSLPSRCS